VEQVEQVKPESAVANGDGLAWQEFAGKVVMFWRCTPAMSVSSVTNPPYNHPLYGIRNLSPNPKLKNLKASKTQACRTHACEIQPVRDARQ
jgi:hypothetical protein